MVTILRVRPCLRPVAIARCFTTADMRGRSSMGSIFDPYEPTVEMKLFANPKGYFSSRFGNSYHEFQLKRKVTTYDRAQFPSLAYHQLDKFFTSFLHRDIKQVANVASEQLTAMCKRSFKQRIGKIYYGFETLEPKESMEVVHVRMVPNTTTDPNAADFAQVTCRVVLKQVPVRCSTGDHVPHIVPYKDNPNFLAPRDEGRWVKSRDGSGSVYYLHSARIHVRTPQNAAISKTKETSATAPPEFVRFARLAEPNQLDRLHHIDTVSQPDKPEVSLG